MNTKSFTIPSWVMWLILVLATGTHYAYESGIALFMMYSIVCFNLIIAAVVLFCIYFLPLKEIHITTRQEYEKYICFLVDGAFAYLFLKYASENQPIIIFQFTIIVIRILLLILTNGLKRRVNENNI